MNTEVNEIMETCEVCGASTSQHHALWSWNRYNFDGAQHFVCNECARKYKLMGYSEEHGVPFEYRVTNEEIGRENSILLTGFELETEHNDNNYYSVDCDKRDLTDLLMRKEFIDNVGGRVASDGSLSYGGQEFISNPTSETQFYIDAENFYKPFFTKLSGNNYVSHNGGRCGLHFHVSKGFFTREDYPERILCIMDNFKDFLKTYSRRTNFRWCQFISDRDTWQSPQPDFNEEYKTLKFYKDNMSRFNENNHGMALNLRNGKPTIEFRIMRGTLNFDSFMASYELIKNIVKVANSDKEINDITWGDLVVGEYAHKYAEERGLTEYDKHCIDYTDSLSKKLEKKLEYERKMLAVLENNVRTLLNSIKLDKSTYENISELSTRTRNTINDLYILQNFTNGVRATQNAILSNERYSAFLSKLNDTLSALDGRKKTTKVIKNKISKLQKEFEELGVMNTSSSN